jgi:CheY-like chemotaxis protein
MNRVMEAALRASELVRQILSFSRKSDLERTPQHLITIVTDTCKLLRPSIPATIEIVTEISVTAERDQVLAEPTQLHQVLMNLSTNAAHAMRDHGGTLRIALAEVAADTALLASDPSLQPGDYLHLTVSDTGHGMDPAMLDRIFDPYFTTKPTGEGTGLGLAVVQGIIKSHGGAITVRSTPGSGTTFDILLPLVTGEVAVEPHAPQPSVNGTERILFVDDEQALSLLGQTMLQSLGYEVTTANNSAQALQLFRANPAAFDLLITDLTMPGMTGKALTSEVKSVRPDLPVILCTGFRESVAEHETDISACLMKPYTIITLGQTIRQVLDRN